MAKNNKGFFKSKNSWSEIKDSLLGCYLPLYFQKVLMTRRSIYYIDCFAGQGKFDDGKLGSPLIALAAREACLNRTGNANGKIDLSLIELNHSTELLKNITDHKTQYNSPIIHHGKYEEIIEILLRDKKGVNIFLYIDPYGIRALDYSVFQRISNAGFHSLEMLINFNSFGFFRDSCRAMGVVCNNDEAFRDLDDLVEYAPTEINSSSQSVELLSQIAGGDYWKAIVESFRSKEIDGYTAEKHFSHEYKSRLKKLFSYVLDMPIRLKPGQRPKYRMIHVCNHQDGCFHMAENMLKRKDELFTNIQQNRQPSLFDYDDTITATVENCIISKAEVEKHLLSYIDKIGCTAGYKELVAGFFSEHGLICEINMLNCILKDFENSGIVEVTRIPPKSQTGKPSAFWCEKKDQRIMIRRKSL